MSAAAQRTWHDAALYADDFFAAARALWSAAPNTAGDPIRLDGLKDILEPSIAIMAPDLVARKTLLEASPEPVEGIGPKAVECAATIGDSGRLETSAPPFSRTGQPG